MSASLGQGSQLWEMLEELTHSGYHLGAWPLPPGRPGPMFCRDGFQPVHFWRQQD